MESIKKKLKKVLESDLKYTQFLVDYNNKKDNGQWFTDFKCKPISKQILKYKQWQKNLSKGINPI